MNSSLALRSGFLVLLSAAVLLKVQLPGINEAVPIDFGSEVRKRLVERGFGALSSIEGHFSSVEGRLGACNLLVVNMSPLGWHRDVLWRAASPGSEVFVSYDGARYADQPRWRTMADHYWTRLNRVVGRLVTQPPVLGIVASPGCQAQHKTWLNSLRII